MADRSGITTIPAVFEYLLRKTSLPSFPLGPARKVTRLGGTTNFTFRVLLERPGAQSTQQKQQDIVHRSVILKYAPDYVASDPRLPFTRTRQEFESLALRKLPGKLDAVTFFPAVRLPELIYEDPPNSVIIMSDVQSSSPSQDSNILSLKEFCRGDSGAVDRQIGINMAREIGTALGEFLVELHSIDASPDDHKPSSPDSLQSIFSKNVAAREICAQTTFGDFLNCVDGFGVVLEPARRKMVEQVMLQMDAEVRRASESGTFVMGDFW